MITLNTNTLIFSKEDLDMLTVEPGDYIDIRYMHPKGETAFPVVAFATVFGDTDGKKVTKKGSISFRGEQHDSLAEYGTRFNLKTYKDDIYKLEAIQ